MSADILTTAIGKKSITYSPYRAIFLFLILEDPKLLGNAYDILITTCSESSLNHPVKIELFPYTVDDFQLNQNRFQMRNGNKFFPRRI